MHDIRTAETTPSAKARLPAAPATRKAAMLFIALLIFAVMAVWLGFLGWGVFVLLNWIVDWMIAGFPI